MSPRDLKTIDNRILRLNALRKRLLAERKLAVLKQKHRNIKFNQPEQSSGIDDKRGVVAHAN